MKYGGQNEVGKIGHVLVKRPAEAWISQENVDAQWEKLRYADRPDFARARAEHDKLEALLTRAGATVHRLPPARGVGIDSLYARDSMIITDRGAILCNMGKRDRSGEPDATGAFVKELGIPIIGAISGEGRLEGGDLVWLGGDTLVVGRGYRTNDEGIRQLRELVGDLAREFVVMPLPHWDGPGDVLHLMSMISPLDHDLLAVYSRLLPVTFREWLLERNYELVEIPDAEYESMACNILAVGPRQCIVLVGNPVTHRRLEDAGVEVWEYEGTEISRKGAGGPTCLTRPILRETGE